MSITLGDSATAGAGTATNTWALFAGIALIAVGNGMQISLLGVRAEQEGFGTTVSGLVMAAYFAGFMVGAAYVERALAGVGHIRVFAALASVASSAVLVHSLWVTPGSWGALRFVSGLCMAGLYVVIESWLNDLATNATRGLLLGLYMVVLMGGLAGGQFLVPLADTDGPTLFVVSSVLVSMSLVPLSLSTGSSPPAHTLEPMRVPELFATAPTAVATSLLVGAAQGTLIALGAVYAAASGMTGSEVSAFVAAPLVGAVVFQMPVGRLSDRLPRRGVMVVVAAAASALAAVMMVVDGSTATGVVVMFLLGGATYPLYSVGLAHANDWIEPHRRVGGAGLLVRIGGAGAVVGPLVAAGLMTVAADFYFWMIVVTHAALVCYLIWRIAVREAVPVDDQTAFAPFPPRASRMAVGLLRRRSS